MENMPVETQREVMEVVVSLLGGSAAKAAVPIDVSPRTIEAWRSGKAPLPIKSAYQIAQVIASHTKQ